MKTKAKKKFEFYFGQSPTASSVDQKLKEKFDAHNYIIRIKDLKLFKNELSTNISTEIFKVIQDELIRRENEREFDRESFLNCKDEADIESLFNKKIETIKYFTQNSNYAYKTFKVKKKSGGFREINSPHPALLIIQKRLSDLLYLSTISHLCSHGFEHEKSIITNAKRHVRRGTVLNIDLKNFFPSIHFGRVLGLFEKRFDFPRNVAKLFAQLCTYNAVMPQGAPTSPILSNIICQSLDHNLLRLAKLNKIVYSRYADDLTFSTNKTAFPKNFVSNVNKVIIDEGFVTNDDKFRIQSRKIRQEVTGLVVNQKVNVKRKYIRNLRTILHNLETKSLNEATNIFYNYYDFNKKINSRSQTHFINAVEGMINFVGSVKGTDNETYLKLINRFNEVRGKEKIISKSNSLSCEFNPLEVKNFLDCFSNQEQPELRILVHDGELRDLSSVLDFLKNKLNDIRKKKIIPLRLLNHVKNNLVVNIWEKEGLEKWIELNSKHPLSDTKSEFSKKVFDFKKTYKLGTDENEDTLLKSMVESVYIKSNIENRKLKFVPEGKFNNFSNFKTDVIQLESALKKIFNFIKTESNGNGAIVVQSSKIKTRQDGTRIKEIKIIDTGSVIKEEKSPEDMIKGNSQEIREDLWSLCELFYEVYFELKDESISIPVLSNIDSTKKIKRPIGFVYKLIFNV